ncbi:MAG: hypothetical protein HYU69_02440 [Bacteroidetes bacterium]|nr:hypothetical protein [Bacteroidota bacterium]
MRDYYDITSIWDLVLTPFYLIVIFIVIRVVRINKGNKGHWSYFSSGLWVKVLGALAFGLVYAFYYSGKTADTHYYYHCSSIMKDLLFKNPSGFFSIMFDWDITDEDIVNSFSNTDEVPDFINDSYAFNATRLYVLVNILSLDLFFPMCILTALFTYSGIWKAYEVFVSEFPNSYKNLSWSFFFIPSVFFWGSGVLKDSITISALGWYVYAFYFALIKRKFVFSNSIKLFLASFILVIIKPYILAAALPGSFLWLFYDYLASMRSKLAKFIFLPIISVLIFSVSFFVLDQLGNAFGQYSLDNVLKKAVSTQNDLKKDYYGGNHFDIGDFDGTLGNLLVKAPAAINAALFRPYIWEIKNFVMLISGIENLLIMGVVIFLLIRLRFIGFFRYIGAHPLILFSVFFSVFFALSVGISISNFGALVRLKIPCLPFLVASLTLMLGFSLKNRMKT